MKARKEERSESDISDIVIVLYCIVVMMMDGWMIL